jgi:hypothetical protein
MPDRPSDDVRADLAALIDPLARAARLVLLLDERQPDTLRAEAIVMRPERLFWTLTQLDGGLPLTICQALVRAARLSRGRRLRPERVEPERWSAGTAATAARGWLARRLAALPATEELARWLVGTTTWLAPAVSPSEPSGPVAAPVNWLDLPPLVGPPPGAEDPSLTARLFSRLRGVRRP